MGRNYGLLPLHLEGDMQHYSPQRDTAVQEVKQEAELQLSSLRTGPCGLLGFLKEHGGNSKVNALPKAVPLITHPFLPVFSSLEQGWSVPFSVP